MITLVTRLDTCKGRCPKKGLPSGETTYCFADMKRVASTVRDSLPLWTAVAMSDFYTYPELIPSTVVSDAVPVALSEPRAVEPPIVHPHGPSNLPS
jgi:hypothetical protein